MRRFPPRRILAAADFSSPSLSALQAAAALARLWEASLQIVHVQHPPVLTAWAGPRAGRPPLSRGELSSRLAARLRLAAEGLAAERVSVRTLHGWTPAELVEAAAPERCDLLVMGTHGRAGLERLSFGSIAEAVAGRSRVPVLAVPRRRGPFRVTSVLCPSSGRPEDARTLRYARQWADAWGARLRVLHVPEPPARARELISREAASGRHDLLALPARRRPFSADFLLGSTAERLLRGCPIPMLALPSRSEYRPVAAAVSLTAGKLYGV